MPNSSSNVEFNYSGTYSSTLDTNYTVASVLIQNGGGSLTLGPSGGPILTVTSSFTDSNSGPDFINVSLQGSMTLNVNGTGTLTLSGTNNTYSGYTYLSSGGLKDGNANAFSSNATAVIEVGSGSTLTVNYNETIAGLSNNTGGGSVVLGSGATLVMNGGYSSTFSGNISGAGNLEKDTTGTLILNGTNSYTGTTVINGVGGTAIELGDGTTLGTLATSGVSGTGTLSFDEPSAYTFGANLTGALQVVQNGSAGMVTLSGTNTYSGATTILAGTLQAGSYSAFGSTTGNSAVSVSSGATLDLNGYSNDIGSLNGAGNVTLGAASLSLSSLSNVGTFSGTISGTGSLVMNGYVEEFTGANTYSGGTTINAGTLLADNPSGSATGTGSITITTLGTLQIGNVDSGNGMINSTSSITDNGKISFSRTDTSTFSNPISGTGSVNQFEGGTTVLSGANTYSGTTQIFLGTLRAGSVNAFGGATGLSDISFTDVGTLDLNGFANTVGWLDGGTTAGNIVNIPGTTLTIAGTTGTHSYSGIIQGASGNLAVTGSGGTQILNGVNTYTGSTTIGSGATLQIGNGSAVGATIIQSSNVVNNGTLTFAPGLADSGAYGGIISGSGVVKVSGANNNSGDANLGSITLSGANTYTGGTQVTNGELFVGSSTVGAPGSITSGPVGTGALVFQASTYDTYFSPTANVTLANSIQFNGTVDNDEGGTFNMTLTGPLSGSGTFEWCTWSNLNIMGSNPLFTGTVDVRMGYLFLGSDTALGSSGVILDTGSSIDAFGSSVARAIPNTINVSGASTKIGTGNNNQLTLSGNISGGTGVAVEIDNGSSGSAAFTGTNSFTTSTFTVDNGTVYAGNSTSFGGTGNTLVLDSGSTLDAYGTGVSVTLNNLISIAGTTATFGTGNNNNLTISGVISGAGTSVVTIDNGPSGSVTFSGANTISNTTFDVSNAGTVYAANATAFGAAANSVVLQNGATLNVLGGVSLSNPISVGSGANTLAGNGTITNGGVSVPITNNVILSPSASPGGGPGNLTFTTPLVFVGGAVHFQLYDAAGSAGSGWVLITTGGMDFSGASANSITFNVVSVNSTGQSANTLNFNSANSYSWTFATSPTAITSFNAGDFNVITTGFTNGMGSGHFYVSMVGNNLDLNFTPVPEPSTWALMGLGAAAVAGVALRRRTAKRA